MATKKSLIVVLLSLRLWSVNSSNPTPSLRGPNEAVEPSSYLDPKTIAHKLEPSVSGAIATSDRPKNRRKFISYASSYFEKMWLEHVDEWTTEKKICEVLLDQQASLLHDWLDLACTRRYEKPSQWCIIDDAHHPAWYNRANRDEFELLWAEPDLLSDAVLGEPQPTIPTKEHEHFLSKFVFQDESTDEEYYEYIEPLVSHLRFPLAKCLSMAEQDVHTHLPTTFKGWIIPPPPETRTSRVLYFDIGSSSWNSTTGGGAAMKYFTSVWERQSIEFDEIYAFDADASVAKFYKEFPHRMHSKVHYQQCTVSGSQEEGSDLHPFVPNLIHRVAEPDDYVLLKLDIDMPDVERAIVDFILHDPESRITELVWEHHISGNYLMDEHWGQLEALDQASLHDSYKYFLKLRQKGIRAHSWV